MKDVVIVDYIPILKTRQVGHSSSLYSEELFKKHLSDFYKSELKKVDQHFETFYDDAVLSEEK